MRCVIFDTDYSKITWRYPIESPQNRNYNPRIPESSLFHTAFGISIKVWTEGLFWFRVPLKPWMFSRQPNLNLLTPCLPCSCSHGENSRTCSCQLCWFTWRDDWNNRRHGAVARGEQQDGQIYARQAQTIKEPSCRRWLVEALQIQGWCKILWFSSQFCHFPKISERNLELRSWHFSQT